MTESVPPNDSDRETPRSIEPSAGWFARASLGLVWLSAASGLWSVLVRQAPGSTYRVAGFYDPIESLSLRSLALAAVTLALAPIAARGGLFARDEAPDRATQRWIARATFATWAFGALLYCGAMGYSGATGLLGVQLRDSGQPGRSALVARWTGAALLLGSLALATRSIVLGSTRQLDS